MTTIDDNGVICIMETSVDGRIVEARWSPFYADPKEAEPDVYYDERAKLKPDACLLGRSTIEENFCALKFSSRTKTPIREAVPYQAPRRASCCTVVFDRRGRIAYPENSIWGDDILVVMGSALADEEYLAFLRDQGISYTFAGADGCDLKAALSSLRRDFGFERIVLCGGGILNGAFLQAGLISELYQVIYPGIDGLAGVNTLFECVGRPGDLPAADVSLQLLSCREVRAGLVLLHYRVHPAGKI